MFSTFSRTTSIRLHRGVPPGQVCSTTWRRGSSLPSRLWIPVSNEDEHFVRRARDSLMIEYLHGMSTADT